MQEENQTNPLEANPPVQVQPATPSIVDPIPATPAPSNVAMPSEIAKPASSYAGFWIRLVAAVIDGILISIVGGIINSVVFNSPATIVPTSADSSWASLWVTTLILWLYAVGMISFYGSTVGKMVFGLKVVDQNGQKLTFLKVVLREVVGKFASGMIFSLGFIWIAFDEKKQGWHDKIAGSYVVKVR